jgi:hypothetical protein
MQQARAMHQSVRPGEKPLWLWLWQGVFLVTSIVPCAAGCTYWRHWTTGSSPSDDGFESRSIFTGRELPPEAEKETARGKPRLAAPPRVCVPENMSVEPQAPR